MNRSDQTPAIPTTQPHTAQAIRATILPERRVKGVLWPLGILAMNWIVFVGSVVGIVTIPNYLLKSVLVIINGHVIAALFTVGHDACHGSFTCSRWLNKIIGRIAFLPSLTPFTQWRYSHNYLHHSFTNCKDKDFVWCPLSLEEYRGLPWHLRLLERCYRTLPGLPLNSVDSGLVDHPTVVVTHSQGERWASVSSHTPNRCSA